MTKTVHKTTRGDGVGCLGLSRGGVRCLGVVRLMVDGVWRCRGGRGQGCRV